MSKQYLTLPFPPSGLNPNKRLHWALKAKLAKAYKKECFLLAKEAGLKIEHNGTIRVLIEFTKPDRRKRDDDNIIAAFKSGRDGVAQALGVDDNRFSVAYSVKKEPTPCGNVLLEFE